MSLYPVTFPEMIDNTLSYLKTNIIKEQIIKPSDDLRSIRFFNYPYQALEEAVTNALYHRDYQEREPIEITIEHHGITILNFAGPDRSISFESIKKGDRLCSRRYRNRRLGDFLKELEYTEGRSTGIPTIQQQIAENGSPRATFETNEKRSYMLTFISVHEAFASLKIFGENDGPQNEPQEKKSLPNQILEQIRINELLEMTLLERLGLV